MAADLRKRRSWDGCNKAKREETGTADKRGRGRRKQTVRKQGGQLKKGQEIRKKMDENKERSN